MTENQVLLLEEEVLVQEAQEAKEVGQCIALFTVVLVEQQ
jgi:hypothetical protein